MRAAQAAGEIHDVFDQSSKDPESLRPEVIRRAVRLDRWQFGVEEYSGISGIRNADCSKVLFRLQKLQVEQRYRMQRFSAYHFEASRSLYAGCK